MSNTVLSNESDLLDIEAIGESMYNTFIEERICTGPKNVWDVMHKRKLVTFNSLKKTVKVKVKDTGQDNKFEGREGAHDPIASDIKKPARN